MAITFLDQRKRQTYLIFILPIIVLAIFLILLFNYFSSSNITPNTNIVKTPKIEINWEVLKDNRLPSFVAFEEIAGTAEKVGRDNPFSAYK